LSRVIPREVLSSQASPTDGFFCYSRDTVNLPLPGRRVGPGFCAGEQEVTQDRAYNNNNIYLVWPQRGT
jgi:hypothetical protein